MKCVKKVKLVDKDGKVSEEYDIKRVKDDVASKMVREDGWGYCGKELWKKQHPGRGKKAAAKKEQPELVAAGGDEKTRSKYSKKKGSSYREDKYKKAGIKGS